MFHSCRRRSPRSWRPRRDCRGPPRGTGGNTRRGRRAVAHSAATLPRLRLADPGGLVAPSRRIRPRARESPGRPGAADRLPRIEGRVLDEAPAEGPGSLDLDDLVEFDRNGALGPGQVVELRTLPENP